MICIQHIMYKKSDFPKSGEVYKFRGSLHQVICSKISLKTSKLYFVNVFLKETPVR